MADIVETAVSADMFNTLIKAVEAAGLVDLLKGEGPYTVFAPVDTAFERMPEGALDKLLQDIPRLKKILAYHVVSGDVRSDNLLEIDEAPTVEGSVLVIDSSKGYKVNQAIVLNPDMLADNGVIHAIDSVLMPAIMESTLVD
ncbi:MAG: fasciclin domain-containing protein [Cyanobacteriota bacterium]